MCFFCSQNNRKMFAMKTIKKDPKHLRYILTEKDILKKIRHVSYGTVGWMGKPEELNRILLAESIIMKHPPTQHYLALWTKNLAYYSLETGHVLSFIVENVRLVAHQLNWTEYRQGESKMILIFTCPHFTVWQTVLISVQAPAVL